MICEPKYKVIFAHIINSIRYTNKILVGFSGGLDSTVLLHALIKIQNKIFPSLRIRAVYVNHGLNDKGDEWRIHCQTMCLKWKVKFQSIKIEVIKNKKGIEASARYARYKAFREILLPKEVLVTAQHLDDQVETVLLALKRGSGPSGLSAMPSSIQFADTYLIRPLLLISRYQLVNYAQQNLLDWIDDDSNKNDYYDRNFLRLNILPHLNYRWPQFSKLVARSASLCAEQELLLDELLQNCLSRLVTKEGSLKYNALLDYSEGKRNAILRRWFIINKLQMPSRVQLKQIWQDMICSRPDAEPKFVLAEGNVIRRFKQQLWLLPPFKDITNVCLIWQLTSSLNINLPDNLGTLMIDNQSKCKCKIHIFRAPLSDEKVTVRFGLHRNIGKIKIVGRLHSRKIKKIWQELGVAPWLRNRIPLIYYNNELISAIGVFITESGKYLPGKPKLKITWVKNKNKLTNLSY